MLIFTPRLDSDGYPVLPEVRQRRNDCHHTAGECPIHDHAPPDAGKRLVNEAALPYQDGDRRATYNVLMRASQLPSAPRDRLRAGIRMVAAARCRTDSSRGFCACPQFRYRRHRDNATCLHLNRAGF